MTARPLALLLVLMGLGEVAHGVLAGLIYGGAWSLDPSRWWVGSAARGALLAAAFLGASVFLALLAFVAALGLALDQPWGRWLAVVVAAGSLLTGCAPFGVLALVVLLQDVPEAAPARAA